ncbi:MAG: LysR family transcriptional regulator [Gammaproteobacteria bacterium]|nr:LysR family transcriptional regulator [Gammaproteobacteria bacterium]
MDLILARTFLAIVDAGSFVAASHRLHVTQSTVSVRVRTLETLIGKSLLVRNNTYCELTPAGRQFYRYARSLLRVWEEARHQVAVPESFTDSLAIAGQYSLWDGYLFDWLPRCRAELPTTAFRVSAGMPNRLMGELLEGIHDLVVIHTPELRPGVRVEELFEDQLILVSAEPGNDFRSRYVFMDWGDSFRSAHSEAFPDIHSPGLSIEMGPLGVALLINDRAAGYVPERLVRSHLQQQLLFRIPDAPVFPYPAFAVYQQDGEQRLSLQTAITLLRDVAARQHGAA